MNKIWTDNQIQYIANNASTMTDKEISLELTKISGRTVTINAVRKKRQSLGIVKANGRGKCIVVQRKTENIGRFVQKSEKH